MKKRTQVSPIFIIAIMVAFVGCASLQSNSYKTLSISKSTYDFALSTAADLYKKGIIKDEQKQEIIDAGTDYMNAHNIAVTALKQYNSSGLVSDESDYLAKLSAASKLLSNLLTLIEPYIEGGN